METTTEVLVDNYESINIEIERFKDTLQSMLGDKKCDGYVLEDDDCNAISRVYVNIELDNMVLGSVEDDSSNPSPVSSCFSNASNQVYLLQTQDSTQYHLIRVGLTWTVVYDLSNVDGQRKYSSLAKALHCLGGIVPWDDWSLAAKETLLALNEGKAI